MKLTRTNDERYFEFEREGFGTLVLTANEVCFICNQMTKINLRDSIGYKLDELNGDMIDIEKYPDGDREDFIDEVFTDLEDEIDLYGKIPDEDEIEEKILDTADFYEMRIDE